jgi:hypothetical protein
MRILILVLFLFSVEMFASPLCGTVTRNSADMHRRTVNGWDDVAFAERIDVAQAVYCAGRVIAGNWSGCVWDILNDGAKYFRDHGPSHARLIEDFRKYGNKLEIEIGLSEPYCAKGSNGIRSIAWSPFLRWKKPPPPPAESVPEYVTRIYFEWGYPLQGNEFNHWVAHHFNVGRDTWNIDATKNIIQRHYWDYGLGIEGSELSHWYYHLANVGKDVWRHDQRRDVVRKLFYKCGKDIGDDLDHWYFHSLSVSKEAFLVAVKNDWRCH